MKTLTLLTIISLIFSAQLSSAAPLLVCRTNEKSLIEVNIEGPNARVTESDQKGVVSRRLVSFYSVGNLLSFEIQLRDSKNVILGIGSDVRNSILQGFYLNESGKSFEVICNRTSRGR